MNNRVQKLREAQADKFRRQCDADPVQEITCAGCNRHFTARWDYETHLRYSPGYLTDDGQVDGEWQCPDDPNSDFVLNTRETI